MGRSAERPKATYDTGCCPCQAKLVQPGPVDPPVNTNNLDLTSNSSQEEMGQM